LDVTIPGVALTPLPDRIFRCHAAKHNLPVRGSINDVPAEFVDDGCCDWPETSVAPIGASEAASDPFFDRAQDRKGRTRNVTVYLWRCDSENVGNRRPCKSHLV
jgi:hypothetical protein